MDLTILLAVDDDEPSYEAAAAVARWFPDDARVVSLHVGEGPLPVALGSVPVVAGGGLVGYPYSTVGSLAEERDDELRQHALSVARRGAEIAHGSARTDFGDPVETICRVADEIDADLVVVGTGDRGWLSRFLSPSVGSAVASRSERSVLVVRS